MKIVIIHGTFGNPNENRFPRLKKELENKWHEVWVPKLPTPENQTPSSRCNELQLQVPFVFDKDTVLVGHSLWATYLLHILDRERKKPIKKAVFVSWFVHGLWNEKFDRLNKPFIDQNFNRERIQRNVSESIVFHWDNDPYVPVFEANYLKEKLNGKVYILPWWWHLNTAAWYLKFPLLLEQILL